MFYMRYRLQRHVCHRLKMNSNTTHIIWCNKTWCCVYLWCHSAVIHALTAWLMGKRSCYSQNMMWNSYVGTFHITGPQYPLSAGQAISRILGHFCTQIGMKWTMPSWWLQIYRGWFNKKMPSYQYRKSHCGDKTILRASHLHNGISYIDKIFILNRGPVARASTTTMLATLWLQCSISILYSIHHYHMTQISHLQLSHRL